MNEQDNQENNEPFGLALTVPYGEGTRTFLLETYANLDELRRNYNLLCNLAKKNEFPHSEYPKPIQRTAVSGGFVIREVDLSLLEEEF